MVVLRGKARYQRGHSDQYSGLKLANSTSVLSILGVDFYSHIPQALHFYLVDVHNWKKHRLKLPIRWPENLKTRKITRMAVARSTTKSRKPLSIFLE